MAEWHFWSGTVGILLYIVPIYWAGITQGMNWRAIDDGGNLVYGSFIETVRLLAPLYWIRVLGGLLFVSGVVMCGVNFLMTWLNRPAQYEEPVVTALPLSAQRFEPEQPPPSTLRGAGVLETGKRLDVWLTLWWHRVWERKAVLFTVWVTVAVAVASLFEMIPTFIIRSNVPTIASVRPYTPLELAGRDIYVAEGCYNCHSQMIRPILSETKRYGEYSKPGEFIYDRPFQWGSRRIGPDLAREGGVRSSHWHVLHFLNPQEFAKGSIMPTYEHLLEDELNFKQIPPRVRSAHLLGAPYERELTNGVEMARGQAAEIAREIEEQGGMGGLEDKKVIALIAYIQRLGTDLFAPPPETAPDASDGPGGSEPAMPEAVADGYEEGGRRG
jgi:cytochrome c oxidase cbb3-type subunit I/II